MKHTRLSGLCLCMGAALIALIGVTAPAAVFGQTTLPTPQPLGTPTLLPGMGMTATFDPLLIAAPTLVLTPTQALTPTLGGAEAAPTRALPSGPFTSGARNLVRVDAESLFVRRLPAPDGEVIASLFEDEILQAVGRSGDGSWFEVRRIGRMTHLGWVLNAYLNWDLQPEALPLTDLSTGVTGPNPLGSAPALAVYLEEAPFLRELPSRNGRAIQTVPALVVVPVIARNDDTTWLQVNYFGFQGWITRTVVRERPGVDFTQLPVPPGLPPSDAASIIRIPIELQQAQIDRVRAFTADRRALASGLEAFWWQVYRGEIMPCDAPAEVAYYPYVDQDIRELPELGRYVPQLLTAMNYLRDARDPLLTCGVVSPSITVDARNSAINSGVVLEAILERLENLEETIYANR